MDVVDFLDKLFPNRCPKETDTEREIWIAAGAARVVKKLRQIAETQINGVLEDVFNNE